MAGEEGQRLGDALAQAGLGVAVVVQVQLDLAQPGPGQLGQRLEEAGGVLLAGEEERVPGRAPLGIAELAILACVGVLLIGGVVYTFARGRE